MTQNKFYLCQHCGNLVGMIHNSGVPIICCGEKMKELIPGSVDASVEKHVPVVSQEGNTVKVTIGAAEHPMTEAHHIAWIYLQTDNGGQRKALSPTGAPQAVFSLGSDKPQAVFAYCNLHGLWKTEL